MHPQENGLEPNQISAMAGNYDLATPLTDLTVSPDGANYTAFVCKYFQYEDDVPIPTLRDLRAFTEDEFKDVYLENAPRMDKFGMITWIHHFKLQRYFKSATSTGEEGKFAGIYYMLYTVYGTLIFQY